MLEDNYDSMLEVVKQKFRDMDIPEEYVECHAIDYIREKSN
tara:strand:- start:1723 stop:1845 length:123 start_codon:yes stop_codon:yes gene_type:complete